MTTRSSLLLALALLAGWVRPSAAGTASFAGGLPDRLTPGQEVVLRWSDLPQAVEEIEILLSLDGGRTFPIRVSRELDAAESELRWRVPRFETGQAVLRLRMGTSDREMDGPASRMFRISGPTGSLLHGSPEDLAFHEGYLWTGLEPIHGPVSAGLMPPEAQIESCESFPSNAPPDHAALAVPAVRAVARVAAHLRAAKATVRDVPSQAPRLDPLRI